jgi:4-hydroxy-tetrahydrodipicolinate reductase
MTTQVAVVGATGRLGSQVCQVIEGLQAFDVIARLNSSSDLQEMLGADAVVDVTHPGVSATVVDFAVDQGLPVLVGTSGWSADRLRTLEKKVHQIPERFRFCSAELLGGSHGAEPSCGPRS